ncbi:hypothetical protein EV401DRAFT_2249971 [Pisolithus croceorrhizus]|nr:hypothetical protein EV401DRAFT_2249971 [Pisolithus croceorrhizus]
MRLALHSFVALWLCFVSRAYAQDVPTQLYIRHRVVHPNLPVTPWSNLGSISIPHLSSISPSGTPVTFTPAETLLDDLSEFAESVDPALEESLYQVAVEKPKLSEGMWPASVMKGCLMPMSTSSSITVHLSSSGEPLGLDYFLSSIPRNGSCPSPSETSKSYSMHNTTVFVTTPHSPPLPGLRAPPPLTPEGAPIPPVAEKTFLQKYWVYIVIAVVALLISGPPEEPAANGNGPKASN